MLLQLDQLVKQVGLYLPWLLVFTLVELGERLRIASLNPPPGAKTGPTAMGGAKKFLWLARGKGGASASV
jgi:hypothetical protein